MGKKSNTDFLAAYIELDTACAELLGVKRGGITEYINKLKEAKGAPQGNEVLSKLISYRKVRNKLAHEDGALNGITEIEKGDLKWIQNFTKTVSKKKDPISLYEGKADRYVRGKRAANIFKIVLGVLLAIGAAVALKFFGVI